MMLKKMERQCTPTAAICINGLSPDRCKEAHEQSSCGCLDCGSAPVPPLAPGNPTRASGTGLMVPVGQVARPPGASPPFMDRNIQMEPSPEPSDSWFSARPTCWSLLAWLLVLGCAMAHSDGLPLPSFGALEAMLCITLCALTNLPDSPTPTMSNALRLFPRGLRYPAPSGASSVPLKTLLWPALYCSLARTA